MSTDDVAYIECLQAQEALYWWARQRGLRLDDKTIGDMLRIVAPILRDADIERERFRVALEEIAGGEYADTAENVARAALDS